MKSSGHRHIPDGDTADDERKAFESNALSEMALDASSTTAVVEPELPDVNPLVVTWHAEKHGLGHRFSVGGNRLRITKWSLLTDADRAFIREHREAIKNLIRSGLMPDVCDSPEAQTPAPVPPAPAFDLDAVGIETYETNDGTIGYTHSLGDEYAEQVMSGVIPLDVALLNERRVHEQRDGLRCAPAITIHTLVRK